MKKRRREGKKIKTEYACIKFKTFVPMATIQHVIHLSSRIRVDGVHCLAPGEHGCLGQTRPPLPPSDRHPGHSPRCYFSLIHIRLVFSSLITRQMTTTAKKKKKKEEDNAAQYWGIAFMILMNRGGGMGLGRNSGPLPSHQHLKDFPALVYRSGGWWRQRGASTSMAGCQDQFNSHNGRKGHLTSVIFFYMLQSCCWLAPLRHFPCEWHCAVWMLSLCRGCWMSDIVMKHLVRFIVLIFFTELLLEMLNEKVQVYLTVSRNLFWSNMFCFEPCTEQTDTSSFSLWSTQPLAC